MRLVLSIGVGGGLSTTCCYHTLPLYFHKRLGLANGIMVSGGSLGIMLLPQLASFMQDQYPFQLAALIIGEMREPSSVVDVKKNIFYIFITRKTG